MICVFCDKSFTREYWFKRHNCDKKKQFAAVHNLEQIRAHRLFNHWCKRLNYNKHGRERTVDEFRKSPFSRAFLDLSQHVAKKALVSPFRYLNFLIDHQISERDWCKLETVKIYRKISLEHDDPLDQAHTTVAFIRSFCEHHDMALHDFFAKVRVGEILNYISIGKFSPWVLLGYDKSVAELVDRFDDHKLYELDEVINFGYWIDKIQESPEKKQVVQEYCQQVFE